MNLYEIRMEHHAQKGSSEGIVTYLVAESNEEVYEWLRKCPELKNGRDLYVNYRDYEEDGKTYDIYNDDYEVIGSESYKERMIRLRGELYDEDTDFSDLYYGKELIGWRTVKEGTNQEAIKTMQENGISLEIA